jgi:hypothetical protein
MKALALVVLGAAVAVFYGLETALTFRAEGLSAPVIVKGAICMCGLYLCLRSATRNAPGRPNSPPREESE